MPSQDREFYNANAKNSKFKYIDELFSEARSLASAHPQGLISSNDLGRNRGQYLVRNDALRIVSRTVINGKVEETYKLSEFGIESTREYA